MAGEFDLIAEYFRPLSGPAGLGLVDDAACVSVPPGKQLIVTKDLLVEGVHFVGDEPAASIAWKSLACNLSDLAAKGADPFCYWLGISLPKSKTGPWLKDFSAGLKRLQEEAGLYLAGGDTTSNPKGVVISITAAGLVPEGEMILRRGAKVGDDIYVSGTLGDAALGLLAAQGMIKHNSFLLDRYQHPKPRLALGQALRGVATACADISDGLLADLGHICDASGVGATIEQAFLPMSPGAVETISDFPEHANTVVSGGDDYELVLTAAPMSSTEVAAIARDLGLPLTKIGTIKGEQGVQLVDPEGKLVQCDGMGYQHFSDRE